MEKNYFSQSSIPDTNLLKMSTLFRRREKINKRVIDVTIALPVFILVLPLIVVIFILIRLETPGNPFFLQSRLGRGGKLFTIYKFRTLYIHHFGMIAEQEEPADYRITPFGKILRRTKLDELPQLLNVLLGYMSLVGPRPYPPCEFAFNKTLDENRLLAKPGLTGAAQISGNVYLGKENIGWADSWYIEHYSFRLDVRILLYTLSAIIKGESSNHDPLHIRSLMPVKDYKLLM